MAIESTVTHCLDSAPSPSLSEPVSNRIRRQVANIGLLSMWKLIPPAIRHSVLPEDDRLSYSPTMLPEDGDIVKSMPASQSDKNMSRTRRSLFDTLNKLAGFHRNFSKGGGLHVDTNILSLSRPDLLRATSTSTCERPYCRGFPRLGYARNNIYIHLLFSWNSARWLCRPFKSQFARLCFRSACLSTR